MLTQQKEQGGLSAGTRGQLAGKSGDGLAVVCADRQKTEPKLSDAGISKDLSSRAQKLAARWPESAPMHCARAAGLPAIRARLPPLVVAHSRNRLTSALTCPAKRKSPLPF